MTPRNNNLAASIDRPQSSKVNKSLLAHPGDRLHTDSGVPDHHDQNLTTEGEVIYETLNSSRQSDKGKEKGGI